MKYIRNFSIIAHIDHGKSTLSDRIIEMCEGVTNSKICDQVLDSMDLERERGMTIKAQSVRLNYHSQTGHVYQFNFIDTPGHVDFSYEVYRSLAACEGALLVVDAGKGVEAQTVANCSTAIEKKLKIIPIINKVDLPTANSDITEKKMEEMIEIDTKKSVRCSSKTGIGIIDVLEKLICDIPAPTGNSDYPLQAFIMDSWFDNYLGVISLVRIKNGVLYKGYPLKVMSTGKIYSAKILGIFTPQKMECEVIHCGEVGWLACSIKDIIGARVGDTFTQENYPAEKSLPCLKNINPQVYASLFPVKSEDYENFCDALGKLSLNDSSLFYEPEISTSLGFGFRCGLLGILHLEIIKERLQREYSVNIITTVPSVVYQVITTEKKILYVDKKSNLPDWNKIKELREPISYCNILVPKEFLGNVITLCVEKRGVQKNISVHGKNVSLKYEIPMGEVVWDFLDRLKSTSSGYASLEYQLKYFQKSDMVCIDIFLNSERIDAFSIIIHRTNAKIYGREIVEKIKNIIPRQQFDISIKAYIGTNIIARSTVKKIRKNVLEQCSGGDISRKKKLIQKQKEGKKRMKKIGNVELPKEIFFKILNIGEKR